MEPELCDICQGEGYIDVFHYCECNTKAFYEGKDELSFHMEYSGSDIELSDSDDMGACEDGQNTWLLQFLPFSAIESE